MCIRDSLAGIESVRWLRQNDGGYAYEQVTNGKTCLLYTSRCV